MPPRTVEYLCRIQDDIRGEVKQRIAQRDQYSVQLTLALAAVFAISFSEHGSLRMLFAAPIASLYYTVLILYSYSIHDILAAYLREVVEPELARRSGAVNLPGWETYYIGRRRPGIRREFFLYAHWVVTLASCVLAIGDQVSQRKDPWIDVVLTVVIVIASMFLTQHDWRERVTIGTIPASSQTGDAG